MTSENERPIQDPQERLTLVHSPEQDADISIEFKVNPEKLDEMLDPENIADEMKRVKKKVTRVMNSKNDWTDRLNKIIFCLLARGEKSYLPLGRESEKSFILQRTAQMEKEK